MSSESFRSELTALAHRARALGAECSNAATVADAWKRMFEEGSGATLLALLAADPHYRRYSAPGVYRSFQGENHPGVHTLAYWAVQRALCVGTDQTIAELDRYRDQSAYHATVTMTLAYLTIAERFDLSGGVRVIPYTMEDFCGPRPRRLNGVKRQVDPMDDIVAALQIDIDYPVIDVDQPNTGLPHPAEQDALEQLRQARLCLGLMRPSFVAEVGDTVRPGLSVPGSFPESRGTRSKGFIDYAPTVELTETELSDARTLYERYRALTPEKKEKLRTPIQRLETSIIEQHSRKATASVDAAIDLGIALESLLMGNGPKTELSYRFALRGAHLLGGASAADRKVYHAKLNGLYQIRSSAVHEGAIKSKLDKPAHIYGSLELLSEGYGIAARAIRETIMRNGIPEDWESIVLG